MVNSHAIAELSSIVGKEIPADYVRLLTNYPPSLQHQTRSQDDPDLQATVSDVELLNNQEMLVAINLEVRREALVDPAGQELEWPNQFLVIGETGTGDYFCIDVEGDVTGVIQFNHQAVEFEVIAESLTEFIEILEETFDENSSLTDDDLDDDEDDLF